MTTKLRTSFIILVALVALVGLTACGTADSSGAASSNEVNSEPFHPEGFLGVDETLQTDFDPLLAGVPAPEGYRTSLDRDAIFPVYQPVFNEADQAGWPDDELIIGVEREGDARAYPVGFLRSREIVNDIHNGQPTLVTWCPLCGTGMVHSREVNGEVLSFGNQGDLHNNAMTLFDHGTGTIWSQPFGSAIIGELEGAELELQPSTLTTWGAWKSEFPNSIALAAPSVNAGTTINNLHIVVDLGDAQTAVSARDLETEVVINTNVGETQVAFIREPGLETWHVVNRDIGDQIVTLSWDGENLVDDDGTEWALNGIPIDSDDPTLAPIAAFTQFVDDFRVFFPDGTVVGE